MQAIIMAGGQGTRLKAVTGDTPKPMALLAGRPILEHILLLLRRCGIRHVCLALRYRPEVIQDYFGDGARWGLQLEYHAEQEELGTAGCVRACRSFYGDRDFLVISGDCACDYDLRVLTEAHRRLAPAVTMALATHETPLQYGTVLTDRDNRVVSFVEKPTWNRVVSDRVNTGIYVLSPRAMERVPEGRPFDFAKDLFPLLLREGETILGLPMEGYWGDIGTPQSYHQCNLDALEGRLRLEAGVPSGTGQPQAPDDNTGETENSAACEVPCRSRARLMRQFSQYLMEAGAEFAVEDGLSFRMDGQHLRLSPATDREALLIHTCKAAPGASDKAARTCRDLLQSMEG